MRNDELLIESGLAARLIGVSQQTVRYYEINGILPAVMKTASGRRLFKRADVLKFKRARDLKKGISAESPAA